jgi:hypothetical protein
MINEMTETLLKSVGEHKIQDENIEEVKDFYISSFITIANFGHPTNFFRVLSLLIEQTSHNIPPQLFNYIVEISLNSVDRAVLLESVNMTYTYLFHYRLSLEVPQKYPRKPYFFIEIWQDTLQCLGKLFIYLFIFCSCCYNSSSNSTIHLCSTIFQ